MDERYGYFTPSLFILIFVYAFPFIYMVYLSFYRINIIAMKPMGIAFVENYLSITSPDFVQSIRVTAVWTTACVILSIVIGLGIALVLNEEFKGRAVIRAIVILPWVIPMPLGAMMWRWFYNPYFGLLNSMLQSLNIITTSIDYLSPKYAIYAVILARVWRSAPYCAITILAGLTSISKVLYEAADMDGASSLQKFRHITIPLIKPVVLALTIIITVWTINVFDVVWVMTQGGPADATNIFAVHLYKIAFVEGSIGLGSAQAVMMILLLLVPAYFYLRASEKG